MFTMGTISAPEQNINSCSHCIGATFETEQKPSRYSVNIALLSYFPNFHGQRSGGGGGGGDLSISYLKQNCFSHREGLFKESIHKQFYSK